MSKSFCTFHQKSSKTQSADSATDDCVHIESEVHSYEVKKKHISCDLHVMSEGRKIAKERSLSETRNDGLIHKGRRR